MKKLICRLVLVTLISSTAVSCTTAYDAYGNPQQVVDPGAAVLGAAAVGLLAYGLANNDDHHHRYSRDRHSRHGGFYSSGYRRPYYGHRNYCHY
jgi:hypothetical protein